MYSVNNKKKKKSSSSSTQKGSKTNLKRSKLIVPFWICYGVVLLIILGSFVVIASDIPTVEQLEKDIQKNQLATVVYSADGKELGRYYYENRSNCRYSELSPNLLNALIATEDSRFYNHSGIDFKALVRVGFGVLSGKNSGGGSTITQQLAKNLYPREGNLVVSKLREWIVAIKLEREYSKDEIITMYLNTVDFSHQAMGIETAAQRYFSRKPIDLKIEEAAMLVGLLKAPGNYDPLLHPEAATQRRNVVISQMSKYDLISENEAQVAKDELLDMSRYTKEGHEIGQATYLREYLRIYLTNFFSQKENCKKNGDQYNIYKDGLKIYTTIDSRMQEYAEAAVEEHVAGKLQPIFFNQLKNNTNAPFYRLSAEQTEQILTAAMKRTPRYAQLRKKGASQSEIKKSFNTRVKMKILAQDGVSQMDTVMTPMDSIRYMKSFLQCGFMAMEPTSGKVKAYVGGMNYSSFQFDHVTGARRQVGSTFKPYVYASAMENSNGTLDPCSMIPNRTVSVRLPEGSVWTVPVSKYKPNQNIMLREALAMSLNNVSADLITRPDWGRQFAVIELVRKMGVKSPLPEVPSICLGACELSLYEQVGAINCFANQGVYIAPYFISKICDKNDEVIYEKIPETHEAMSQLLAFQTVCLMKGVVEHGTGRRLISQYGLNFPLAGKTGTTDNHSDAWFVGYTPTLTCGVWVGCDDRAAHFTSMEYGQGARAAMPVFGLFMQKCYADAELPYKKIWSDAGDPRHSFMKPDGFTGNEYGCLPDEAKVSDAAPPINMNVFD